MNPTTLYQAKNLEQSRADLNQAKRAVNDLIKTSSPYSYSFVNLANAVSNLIKEIEIFEHLNSLELTRQATIIQKIKQVLEEDNQSKSTITTPNSQMHLQAQPQHNQITNQADIKNETASQSECPILPATFEYDPAKRNVTQNISHHIFLSKANALVQKVGFVVYSEHPLQIRMTLYFDKKDQSNLIKFLSTEGLDYLNWEKNSVSTIQRDECIKILTILTTRSKIRINSSLLKYINEFISPHQLETNNLALNETDTGYYSHLILNKE